MILGIKGCREPQLTTQKLPQSFPNVTKKYGVTFPFLFPFSYILCSTPYFSYKMTIDKEVIDQFLKVGLATYPYISLLMDVVVIDVLDTWECYYIGNDYYLGW
jgi:hypothetical protein